MQWRYIGYIRANVSEVKLTNQSFKPAVEPRQSDPAAHGAVAMGDHASAVARRRERTNRGVAS